MVNYKLDISEYSYKILNREIVESILAQKIVEVIAGKGEVQYNIAYNNFVGISKMSDFEIIKSLQNYCIYEEFIKLLEDDAICIV